MANHLNCVIRAYKHFLNRHLAHSVRHDNIRITYDNGTAVKISVFLVGYNYTFNGVNSTVERHEALKLVFKYWKEIGKHKSRTKELYECREFMKYLDAINFTEADYLIIGKP